MNSSNSGNSDVQFVWRGTTKQSHEGIRTNSDEFGSDPLKLCGHRMGSAKSIQGL